MCQPLAARNLQKQGKHNINQFSELSASGTFLLDNL
jgi:hypothetical protein